MKTYGQAHEIRDIIKNNRGPLVLASIAILGFALRIYRLGNPSLWFDELNTAGRANCPFFQVIPRISDVAFPPLYYLLMSLWIGTFGNSEFSLRFPSLIFSTLSVIFIFKLSKELFGGRVGWFAALFASISPISVYYAQEAKMYSMLWFFGILSFLFFHRFSEGNKTGSLVSYVIFTTITIYTQYIGFIFIVIQNIFSVSLFRGTQLKKWLRGQLAILVLYLPWISKCLSHFIHRPGAGWIPKVDNYPHLLALVFSRALTGKLSHNNVWELCVYCLLIISAFVSVTDRGKRYSLDFGRNDYMLFLWIVTPIIVYGAINAGVCPMLSGRTTRYISFIYIPLCILISKGINKYRVTLKAIIVIYLLCATFSYRLIPLYGYNYRVAQGDDWRGFSHQLQQRADKKSLLLTGLPSWVVSYYNEGYEIRFMDYLSVLESQPMENKPNSVFIIYRGRGIDTGDLRARLRGYQLKEEYNKYPIGFVWFEKQRVKQAAP